MTGGQITALVFAILLFFPGACFLVVGIGVISDRQTALVGFGILAVVGLLGWLALRKRPPPAPGATG